MTWKVIDVSKFNGRVDWDAVKGNIDGAILRCGYGDDIASQDDPTWRENADACTRLGIPFGTYLYSYADSEEHARSEAAHVLRLIRDYKLSYPVYYDLEDAGTVGAVSAELLKKIVTTFADRIESSGHWCGLYADLTWFDGRLRDAYYDRYTKWIAEYSDILHYDKAVGMWQYTSEGRIPGIEGNVDLSRSYRDFPALIRKDGSSSGNSSAGEEKRNMMGQRGPKPKFLYSGLYDPSVKKLQEILNTGAGAGLKVDGIAGPKTYAACIKFTVHLYDRGRLIQWVQERLNLLGYNAGYADGYAEQPTMDGIARFQRAYGLGVGYLGGTDWYYMIES